MPQTQIRFAQTGTLYTPSLNSDGQLTFGSGTSIRCALWKTSRHEFVAQLGEAKKVDATAFVPSGTSVTLRDQLLVAGALYEVVNVHEAHDDRNRVDHVGLQLRLVSG